VKRFAYLGTGLGIVLMFIGVKMLVGGWIHIPTGISLAVVGTILGIAVAVSILRPPSKPSNDS
jgi:tellurite resistance protein TerC